MRVVGASLLAMHAFGMPQAIACRQAPTKSGHIHVFVKNQNSTTIGPNLQRHSTKSRQ
jgi:hypothetical protein